MCETKACTKCGETKRLDGFYASKQRGGRTGKCKVCILAEKKADRAANPEKFKERDAAARKLTDPEVRLARSRESAQALRVRMQADDDLRQAYLKGKRAQSLAWTKANPEKRRESVKKWYRANSERHRKATNKWRAANRGRLRDRLTKQVASLGDSYVKHKLQLPPGAEVPQLLVELKRAQIQLYRAIYGHKKADDSNATTT